MGCCGKTKQILNGWSALLTGKKYSFTDRRIRRCNECKYNMRNWCIMCKCYIPAAARARDKNCPKNYWERKEMPTWAKKGY